MSGFSFQKLFLLLSLLLLSGELHAQVSSNTIAPTTIAQAIEAELAKSPSDRYLYNHADAFNRVIQLRALRALGIDPPTAIGEATNEILAVPPADTGVTVDATKSSTAEQNETSIAINRANPKIIVAGANDSRMYSSGMPAYVTSDKGKTWSTKFIPIPKTDDLGALFPLPLGDPAIVADDSGYFYYAYLAMDQNYKYNNLIVATSKDGKTWVNGGYIVAPDQVGGFEDKEQIAVDLNPNSPHHGRVYVAWRHLDGQTGEDICKIASSDDRGKTWSSIVDVFPGTTLFSSLRTGKNGEVILTYSVPTSSSGEGDHVLALSKDGGKHFGVKAVRNFNDYPINAYGRDGLKGDSSFRAYPYISQDVELTTDKIHLVYGSYETLDNVNYAAILYYVSSTDLGKTWTAPLPVGLANPAHSTLAVDRFNPWVSVNQRTGEAFVTYYSSEDDSDENVLVAMYRQKLTATMKEYPTMIGDRVFDPRLVKQKGSAPFLGDYIGSDAFDTVFVAAWTENRKGGSDGDVFVYISTPKPSGSTVNVVDEPTVVHSSAIWLAPPSPNPASGGSISVRFYIPRPSVVTLELVSIDGSIVKKIAGEYRETGSYSESMPVTGLTSGTYILRIRTPYDNAMQTVIISR
ncbi:MAG: T9SS type A sorting domain-containing protein [bacterium]